MKRVIVLEKLNEIIRRVFNFQGNIDDDASPKSVKNWNSMNHLLLITEIEENFNVKLSDDEVSRITSVKDIKDLLKKHGI